VAHHRPVLGLWRPGTLVLLSVPVLFYGLGSYGIVNGDEAVYHEIAQAMAKSGDWWHYQVRGQSLDYSSVLNPPLFFWMKAGLLLLFGDSYWTMRVLSALFGLLCVLVTYRLGSHVAGRDAGWLSGLALLTTWQFVYWHSARTGEMETAIALLYTLAAYLFLRALETGRGFVAHHLVLALLMNLKLPLVALPLLAEMAFLALTRQHRRRLLDWALVGLAVAPLGFLWPLLLAIRGEDVGAGFREMLQRAEGMEIGGPLDRRYDHPLGNAWYYACVMMFGAYPHVLAFPPALLGAWIPRREESDRLRFRLLGLFVLVVFGFFIAVGRHSPWYIVPAIPALCVFLGAWLESLRKDAPSSGRLPAVLGIAAAWLWVAVDLFEPNPFAYPAVQMPAPVALRAGAAAALAVGAVALAGLLWASGARLGRRLAPLLFASLTALLLGTGAVRVLAALRFTPYVSEMEQLSRTLQQAKAEHTPLPRELVLREPFEGQNKKVWFYFGEDYQIVRQREGDETVFKLHKRRFARD
jgi:4-amino-4-deoxy-L-arabinose transferase-like glycosyltransferase